MECLNSLKPSPLTVPTFISFLRDVESPIEVREYVINFLGDTKATDDFVKDFVIKRKSMNNNNAAANNQVSYQLLDIQLGIRIPRFP